MPTLTIYLDSTPLTSFPVEWSTYTHSSRGTQIAYHAHTAYICPTCGKLWARAVYSDATGYPHGPLQWLGVPRLCLDCGGTLVPPTDPPMSNDRHGIPLLPLHCIPRAHLPREFLAHLTLEETAMT